MTTSSRRAIKRKAGFSLVELLITMALSTAVMAGLISTMLLFTKSSLRLSAYNSMESQATRGIEIFGRDLRMAQKIVSSGTPINQVVLTIPPVGTGSTTTVTYRYETGTKIFTRNDGVRTTTLIRDIDPGSFKFVRFDMAKNSDDANADGTTPGTLISDYATNQLQVSMTSSPSTNGLYARSTKRVISARFVLRNR